MLAGSSTVPPHIIQGDLFSFRLYYVCLFFEQTLRSKKRAQGDREGEVGG